MVGAFISMPFAKLDMNKNMVDEIFNFEENEEN
jgi:hypothetical protein